MCDVTKTSNFKVKCRRSINSMPGTVKRSIYPAANAVDLTKLF